MDIPEWLVECAKVGAGAIVGVFAGTRRMEARVRTLEDRQQATDQKIATHDKTLEEVHETVQVDHDLLTRVDANLQLIMQAMQLRPRT